MLVSGVPEPNDSHAKHAADIAMDMVQTITKVKIAFLKDPMRVKLGMHSGPVVAGIYEFSFCDFNNVILSKG